MSVSRIFRPHINLIVAQDRGGMGDIAATLVMAERLAAAASDRYQFSLSVRRSVLHKVRVLWPDCRPGAAAGPANLPVFSERQPTTAAAALTFSYFEDGPRDAMLLERLAGAPLRLVYQEPGASGSHQDPGLPGWQLPSLTPAVSVVSTDTQTTLTRRTGAGAGGFYFDTPPRPLDRHAAIAALCAAGGIAVPDGPVRLAFCYCRDPGLARGYAEAISARGGAHPILLATNHPSPVAGITVLRAALPLPVTAALIQASDEMPLLTGDVSLSLRLAVARPFFYELNVWKTLSITGLLHQLRAAAPQLDAARTQAALTLPVGQAPQPERFSATLADAGFQSDFQHGLSLIQEENALVPTVLADLSVLLSVPRLRLSQAVFSVLSPLWRRHGDAVAVAEAARAQVFSDVSLTLRRDTLLALLAVESELTRETLSVFEAVFSGLDPLLLASWRALMTDNLQAAPLQTLCRRLWDVPGLQETLRDIVHQDATQYVTNSKARAAAQALLEGW